MKKAELIFVPSTIPGHLASTLEFAKRLIDHDDRIQITVILMNIPLFPRSDAHTRSLAAGVNLINLPELAEDDQPSPEIFGRTYLCLIDVAKESGIPSYVYFTSNAGFLALIQNLPERHTKIDGLTIPGIQIPVPTVAFRSSVFNNEVAYGDYVKLAQKFLDVSGFLVNTFCELESHSMDHFASSGDCFPPVYPVGPVLDLKAESPPESEQGESVMKWLDGQPEASVVFLCFGSFGKFGPAQAKEIAKGLELSGCRFLWSLRTTDGSNTEDILPEGFLGRVDGRGKMITGWAPQISILSHKSVGGFVSHCGWNSILESIWFGVPIATWPMYAEQQLNAFRIAKELRMAVELRLDYCIRDVVEDEMRVMVMAGEIERAVRCLMDEGDDGGNAARKKTKEMSEMARKAVVHGGSSFSATKTFVMDVLGTATF